MEILALFPLNLVLFPESMLPLHIFEERYKRMINNCLANDLLFGINLFSNNKLFDIGCTAQITEVLERYGDGRMNIIVRGERRYKMNKFWMSDKEYYNSEVTFIQDSKDIINRNLLNRCIDLYNEIADIVVSVEIKKLDKTNISLSFPSFFIAQKSGLTNDQKYSLLEFDSENLRLEFMIKHLQEILPTLRESEKIGQIMKYDGYYTGNMKIL